MKAEVDLRAVFAKAGTVSSEEGSKKCRDADGSNHVGQCVGGPTEVLVADAVAGRL